MRNVFVDGDSITEGNHLASYTDNWPYKLASRLGTVTGTGEVSISGQSSPATSTNTYTVGTKYKVWNVAVGGSWSSALKARWDNNVGTRINSGDTYVLLIGVNDISLGYDLNTVIEPNIISIVGKAQSAGAHVELCTLTPWPGGSAGNQTILNNLNTWIRSWGAANNCTVVDLYAANPAMQGDNVHPTAAGCTTLANTFDISTFPVDGSLVLSTPFSVSGSTISVTARVGVHTVCTGSVTCAAGRLVVNDARFDLSLNGVDYSESITVPSGTTTFYLGVTPQTKVGSPITTQLGVPI